ncbi:MAG: branched-chain amino acid ABC transporter permease [Clostridiales bacterium]|nr:branched-chain amino acid ABC transporter permease [Clostridiales bacterium]
MKNELYNRLSAPLKKIGLSPLSVAAFILLALFPFVSPNAYITKLGITCIMWGTLAMGFDFSVGYINVSNWGYAGLMGLGAYVSALLLKFFDITPWAGMIIAGCTAAAIGFVIAVLTMRMDAMFTALLAWFVGIVLQNIVTALPEITRGAMGLNVKPIFRGASPTPYYYLILAICILTFCVLHIFVNSKFGFSFKALGQDIEAAKAIGISPFKYRTINFVVSCFVAGLVGGFYGHYIGVLSPNVLGTKNVVQILVIAYIGGRGSIWGPLLASFLLMPIFESMNSLVEIKYIIYGLVLIISMIFFPGGICKLPEKVRQIIKDRKK